MKKIIELLLSLTFVLALVGCSDKPADNTTSVTFQATILEINNETMLVSPLEGSQELKSSDKFSIPMKNMEASAKPEVGDVIEIVFDGLIQELYPATLHEIYSIRVVE